jgi:hypothetical protein
MNLRTLGDIRGSSPYMGACAACHVQFMSLHERVGKDSDGRLICERCEARKEGR